MSPMLQRETAQRVLPERRHGQVSARMARWLLAVSGPWLGGILCLLAGCSRTPTTPAKNRGPAVEQRDNSLQLTLELLHDANDLVQFRSAINTVSGAVTKQIAATNAAVDEASRKLAKELLGLDAAELTDLEAGATQPLDAAHLQSCFLFRDIARQLEVAGLAPHKQASLGFAWAMRHVLLHEQHDEGLPPHLVLQRGFGSVLDRTLVAIELARQWRLAGCVIAIPGKNDPNALLIGIVAPGKQATDIFLFDPRRGLPVAGPGGVATIAEVRAKPELLNPHDIGPDDIKQATARSVSALPALSLRMKTLQALLAGHEGVILHDEIAGLQQRLADASLPLAAWPASDALAPARRLRQYYPSDEGGTDKGQRLLQHVGSLMPLVSALHTYQQLRIFDDVGADSREMLTKITSALFDKYYLQPRTALLRGRYDEALKRIDRISNVIQLTDGAISEAEFQKQLVEWRNRVRDAYAARSDAQREKGKGDLALAEAKLKQLWYEDLFLGALLQPDDTIPPQKYERKMLTYLILRGGRDALASRAEAVKASVWHDKAAKLQAQADERPGKGRDARDATASSWQNARSAWVNFVDRAELTPAQFRARLAAAAAVWRQGLRDREFAIALLEKHHLDLHHSLEGRLCLAEANLRLGQSKNAAAALAKARDDLIALDQLEEPRKLLQECLDQAHAQPPNPLHAKRLELLQRDWATPGNLTALRQRVERLLDAVK